jgi:hypothetical protein
MSIIFYFSSACRYSEIVYTGTELFFAQVFLAQVNSRLAGIRHKEYCCPYTSTEAVALP